MLGRAAAETMRRGDLVADDLVTDIMREEVLAPNAVGGFVLDGFPRTVPQAEAAYEEARRNGITFHAVVLLEVPPGELLDRLTRRGQLTRRADDTSETIQHRVEVYLDHTSPLIDYYEAARHLDADRRHRVHRRGHRFDQRPTRPPRPTAEAVVAPSHDSAES